MVKKLVIGTRKSELAMIQTHWVEAELKKLNPDMQIEILPMSTTGDNIQNVALSKIGEKSLFTKELELALERREVDIVVHSLKDLPTLLPSGMVIGAVCEREDPRDAVVMKQEHKGKTLKCLPKGSVIGTSSLRRRAQLLGHHPELEFESVRGNLNTRLRKLDRGDGEAPFAAIVLAAAGIKRMGWQDRISAILPPEECMYAVGQGALAVECRAGDAEILQLISGLTHRDTLVACVAERAFLQRLEGGCSAPVAVTSLLAADTLHLTGGVWSLDGQQKLKKTCARQLPGAGGGGDEQRDFVAVWGPPCDHADLAAAQQLGVEVAEALVEMGAEPILQAAKAANDTAKVALDAAKAALDTAKMTNGKAEA